MKGEDKTNVMKPEVDSFMTLFDTIVQLRDVLNDVLTEDEVNDIFDSLDVLKDYILK